jgi:predicted Zn finger-like uncharacterized protein
MTVIICPACNTRFETAAVIPPTGRKVRCSKCGNVWQAIAVVEPAKPTVITAPTAPTAPAVGPRPAPVMPRPAPAAPSPAAAPRPAPSEPRPASAGPGSPMGRFPGAPIPSSAPAAPGFSAKPNSGALANGGPVPAPSQAPAAKKSGPLFSTDDDMQPDMGGDGSGLAGMGGNSLGGDQVQDFGSYNAGALVNPDAGLATNIPIAEGRKRKLPPAVAIGWGVLALLLIILAALVAMAPKTVVSLLPGSARLYAMMGMNVNPLGLSIENVRSVWNDAGPERVLQISGDIVNLTGGEVKVPTVMVSLEDASGKQLSQATADVLPLGPGAKSGFSVQVPSPPEKVSDLQVSFAKAK